MSTTKNCHYISRFLTKPWEQEDRRLWFYDFDAGDFGRSSSKRLFAADSINSPKVEVWLGRVIETPLATVRPMLESVDPTALNDWAFHRAAILMLWLQGSRSKSLQGKGNRSLEWIAAQSEEDLDTLAALFMEDYKFALVTTVQKDGRVAPLFFPSSGMFPVALRDSDCRSGYSMALAMPLAVTCALVAVPDGSGVDTSLLPGSISNCSVGAATARKVLICPGLVRDAQLKKELILMREQNLELLRNIENKQLLTVEMSRQLGIETSFDQAGRLRKPE